MNSAPIGLQLLPEECHGQDVFSPVLRTAAHWAQTRYINSPQLVVRVSAPCAHQKTVMTTALSVFLCLSVPALNLEIPWNKRFRERAPGNRTWCPLSSLTVTKPRDSHLSNTYPVNCHCSVFCFFFLAVSYTTYISTVFLSPQVLGPGIQNKTVMWLSVTWQVELKQNPSLEGLFPHLPLRPWWIKGWAQLEQLTKGLHCPVSTQPLVEFSHFISWLHYITV